MPPSTKNSLNLMGVLISIVLLFQLSILRYRHDNIATAIEERMTSMSSKLTSSTAPRQPAMQLSINNHLPPFNGMPESVGSALSDIAALRSGSRATFVQIGANNGQTYDPLYPVLNRNKTAWIGLQVEPQPELFSQVAVLHADAPDWSFYNGVLATEDVCKMGLVQFCQTKTPGVGNFRTQGQLNGIRKNCPEETMVQVSRPCVSSWEQLLYQHGGPTFLDHTHDGTHFFVDFIQIDTEGKDYDIIRMIDFQNIKPRCIHYEHTYGNETVRQGMWDYLTQLGYTIQTYKGDTLACLVA